MSDLTTTRGLLEHTEREAFQRGLKQGRAEGQRQAQRLAAQADPKNHAQARLVAWAEAGEPMPSEGWPASVTDPDAYTEQYIDTCVLHHTAPGPEQASAGEFTQQFRKLTQEQ